MPSLAWLRRSGARCAGLSWALGNFWSSRDNYRCVGLERQVVSVVVYGAVVAGKDPRVHSRGHGTGLGWVGVAALLDLFGDRSRGGWSQVGRGTPGNWLGRVAVSVGISVLLGLGVAGCSGADGPRSDFPLTAQELQVELDAAGESQRPFLADGVITPAERERAYLNFVSCAAQRRVEIYDFSLDPRGGDSFNTRTAGETSEEEQVTPDPAEGRHGDGAAVERPVSLVDRVVDECRGEHYAAVGLLFSYQNRRSGQELQQFEADLAQCMRDRGAEVPVGATKEQMSGIDRELNNLCWAENGG